MAQTDAAREAYDHIMSQVYDPVFFAKLAAYNIIPATEHEAAQLRRIGARLHQEHAYGVAAEAEKRGSILDFAIAQLDGAGNRDNEHADTQIKQAAASFIADAKNRSAAIALAESLQ